RGRAGAGAGTGGWGFGTAGATFGTAGAGLGTAPVDGCGFGPAGAGGGCQGATGAPACGTTGAGEGAPCACTSDDRHTTPSAVLVIRARMSPPPSVYPRTLPEPYIRSGSPSKHRARGAGRAFSRTPP